VDDARQLADALGERGSRELLAILERPIEDRVALIGRLYPQGGPPKELAEMLIDLEADDAGRREVIEVLRAAIPRDGT
jgi:hypothetical protein